jgi:hypothetical protein
VSPSYNEGQPVAMYDVRTVEQAQPGPGAAPPPDVRVEALLLAPYLRFGLVKETNLNADPDAVAKNLLQNPDEQRQKLLRENPSVAVAVAERLPPRDPNDPHAFMKARDEEPRLVVFGDAAWISNRRMGPAGEFGLFSGTLAWLRNKADVAPVEAKVRKPYVLQGGTPGTTELLYWRLFELPVTLISLAIVALGAGVWFVRRR